MPWKTCASWLRSVNFRDKDKKKPEKHVPRVVQSSKILTQEKKDSEKAAEKAEKAAKK